jgi:hypothetical protein
MLPNGASQFIDVFREYLLVVSTEALGDLVDSN